jgi:flagellar P-ring protein precursor FlgI
MPKIFLPLIIIFALASNELVAQMRVENVVRVKGQETTVIQGWGIVSGLPGTGDDTKAYTPAARAILRDLAKSGMWSGSDEKGINSAKNNALVRVMVTIPSTGARNGEVLDCTIISVGNAKNLSGGVLSTSMLATSLQQDENTVVLGQAWGRVTIEDSATPTVGRIVNGARLHADFTNPYIQDGLVMLVLKREYVRPSMALKVAEAINENPEFAASGIVAPARAINSTTVVVRMPATAYTDPMDFVARILDAEIMNPPIALPKVTINERLGTIMIDVDVEVRPTLINHKNILAEVPPAPGDPPPPSIFVDVDSDMKFRQMNGENVTNMKLKALQATLDAVKVTTQDMIDIIKTLDKQGAIVGDVVFVD